MYEGLEMKQIYQNFKGGGAEVYTVPSPKLSSGKVLVHTKSSVLSVGTESMVTQFSEKGLLQKAKSRPDLVKQVIDKAKVDGFIAAYNIVKNRLDQPIALGYSSAGIIIKKSNDINNFEIGDRVACAGGGYAAHAEVVSVPKNLVAKIPDDVTFESAAFTTIGSIAMQGIRQANVKLGEVVAVIGLGLIGQITVQLLKVSGCDVIGYDLNSIRVDIAKQNGADAVSNSSDTFITTCDDFTGGNGVDIVLITASTTSNDPLEIAGRISRDKGIVVAVGAVGLTIPRKIYYEKELDFRISRSYGPGRYDQEYEDYPIGYVRWTENRNMQAFLRLLSEGKVDTESLITHRFSIESASDAYKLINNKTAEEFLGVIIGYPEKVDLIDTIKLERENRGKIKSDENISVGLIGAGGFASSILIPALKKAPNILLNSICDINSVTSHHIGKKYGFQYCTTDYKNILTDASIDTIFIATRHNTHAELVCKALESGKNVYVEKPLSITLDELNQVKTIYEKLYNANSYVRLMVGFNRRFSPQIKKMKSLIDRTNSKKVFIMTINPGQIPKEHWTQDQEIGGGRIIGEACHFIDLMRFLAGSPIKNWSAQGLGNDTFKDKVTINLSFENGSLGSIHYLANGSKRFPKERVEVFCGGGIIQLDNFRKMKGYSWPGFKKMNLRRQDKGHKAEVTAFIDAVKNGYPSPIPFNELYEVSKVAIEVANSI